MGDFSRDPNARLQDSVAKHYVGVRLQQGVPILDTDWNELEDLRRHEVASVLQRFFGDGVPDDNDGFRIDALEGSGVDTIVLQAAIMPLSGRSSIAIVFAQSTAASLLGFLPDMASSERPGGNPARITGNETAPFALADGLTLAVQVNDLPVEVVTFSAGAAFVDITQATAAEVAAALGAALANASAQIGTGNDFIIRGGNGTLAGAGRLMVEGVEVINEDAIVFSSQPLYQNAQLAARWDVPVIPALSTPPPAGRTDLVYVDVWDREVDADEDDAIVHAAVGIEASVRLRREWAVRVAEGATALAAVPRLPGHRYGELARIERTAAVDGIAADTIADLRVRNLNVAKYLKTPVLFERGTETIDVERYALMLELLNQVLLHRLEQRVFDFSYADPSDPYDEFLVLSATRDVAQQAAFAIVQTRAGNFNNADALRFLGTLADLQTDLVTVVTSFGNAGNAAQDFINGYTLRLNGGPAALQARVTAGDFIGAVHAQDAINDWLTEPVNILPEGDIVLRIQSVQPTTNLAIGVPFNITYHIESRLTSPQAQERIDLSVATSAPATWNIQLTTEQVVLDAFGGDTTVTVSVTPMAGTVSAVFVFTATAARNPVIVQTHLSDTFQIGQPPPAEEFLVLHSPDLDSQGRMPFAQNLFTSGAGQVDFQVNVVNTSATDEQVFELEHSLTAPAGQEGNWHPTDAESAPAPIAPLAAGATRTEPRSIFGPNIPVVGSEGTLTATATLIAVNGAPVVSGKSRTLTLPFIVAPAE